MKQIFLSFLIMLAVCFGCANTQAQTKSESFTLYSDVPNKTTAQKQSDTITTGTKTQTNKIAGYYNIAAVQVEVNKISGTGAGKAILYGSLNGTSYEKVDSLTIVNVTQQTKVFSLVPSKYVFYRISVSVTGTQSLAFKSLAVARKQ